AFARVENTGAVVPSVDGGDVFARNRAPVNVTGGGLGPALDAREKRLNTGAVALDRESRRAGVVPMPASVSLENGNEVFCAREDKDIGFGGVVVLRQPFVGLARDRRQRQRPTEAKRPVAGA